VPAVVFTGFADALRGLYYRHAVAAAARFYGSGGCWRFRWRHICVTLLAIAALLRMVSAGVNMRVCRLSNQLLVR
jgi:hypothetical protein